MIQIRNLDHLVLTVADISKTCDFYTKTMGMKEETFGPGRKALVFGSQKINLHQAGQEFEPKAHRATPGSADLCFITATPLQECEEHLRRLGIKILEGPVRRTGATGAILSLYFRDPDENLIEISEPIST